MHLSFPRSVERKPLYQAVVWDMDGLIFDTERLSFQAWKAGAEAVGAQIELPLFQALIGMNSAAILLRLQQELGTNVDVAELRREAGVQYERLIAKGAPLKEGAADCLRLLAKLKVPQALATSSSYRFASMKLQYHDLLSLFTATVTGDQVSKGKPHPEPYLLAAQRLGVCPSVCIAFEDSVNGIQSAKTAGMHTVLVPDMCPHDPDSLGRVDQYFDSLKDALPYLEKSFGSR